MAAGWPTATCRPLGGRIWGRGGDHHGWGINPGTVTVPARQLHSDITVTVIVTVIIGAIVILTVTKTVTVAVAVTVALTVAVKMHTTVQNAA